MMSGGDLWVVGIFSHRLTKPHSEKQSGKNKGGADKSEREEDRGRCCGAGTARQPSLPGIPPRTMKVAPALWGAPHARATAISADLFNLSLVAQWTLSVAPSAAGRHQILI